MSDHITKEMEAVIEVTAQRVVDKAIKEFRREMATSIELHGTKCEAKKLAAFKAAVIGIVGGSVLFVAQCLKQFLER